MTNLITFLHTTAAYQAAALQLMIGEANFTAAQLGISERLPAETNQLHVAEVGPVSRGVNGAVGTSNYVFGFDHGRLRSVRKTDWMKRLDPPVTNLNQFSNRISHIDTNGAYQLATQWLAKLSLDVSLLNVKFTPQVTQPTAPAPRIRAGRGELNPRSPSIKSPLPIFLVTWGERPPHDMMNPVRLRLLGTTPELLELDLRDRQFLGRPPLVVSNKAELLGPLPRPREFVERLFGGPEGYRTIAEPHKVELCVLNSRFQETEMGLPAVRAGPVVLTQTKQQKLSRILLDFDTYQWGVVKLCSPDYGVKAHFTRAQSTIDVLFCFECDILEVSVAGNTHSENFDFNHNALAKLVRQVFPRDQKIQRLEINPDEQEAYKRFIQSWEEQVLRK